MTGRAAGLDPDGALRLVDDGGRVHRVVSGEVAEVREGPGQATGITPRGVR